MSLSKEQDAFWVRKFLNTWEILYCEMLHISFVIYIHFWTGSHLFYEMACTVNLTELCALKLTGSDRSMRTCQILLHYHGFCRHGEPLMTKYATLSELVERWGRIRGTHLNLEFLSHKVWRFFLSHVRMNDIGLFGLFLSYFTNFL